MKHILIGALPCEEPRVLGRAEVKRYQKLGSVWRAPKQLGPQKACEAVRCGLTREAGILLMWDKGHAVEVQETIAVPVRDVEELTRLSVDVYVRSFWTHVRQIMRRNPRPSWEAMTRIVNQLTKGRYEPEQVQAIAEERPLNGSPVHEQRFVGPASLLDLHRSSVLNLGTNHPHCFVGEAKLRTQGRGAPCVDVGVCTTPKGLRSLISRARQVALCLADVHMEGLAFTPMVLAGRETVFFDDDGCRHEGFRYMIMFPLLGEPRGSWPQALIQ